MSNYHFYLNRFFPQRKNVYAAFCCLMWLLGGGDVWGQTPILAWDLNVLPTISGVNTITTTWQPNIGALTNVLTTIPVPSSYNFVSNENAKNANGHSMRLDGTATNIHSGNSNSSTTNFKRAVEFFLMPDAVNTSNNIYMLTPFVKFEWSSAKIKISTIYNSSQTIMVEQFLNNLGPLSPNYYTDGKWHHVLALVELSASEARLELWVDGAKLGENFETASSPTLSPQTIYDISINTASTSVYKGLIDEIALYDDIYLDPVAIINNAAIASSSQCVMLPSNYSTPEFTYDRLEFSPTINTPTGSVGNLVSTDGTAANDAIEEFRTYPLPRFKKEANGEIPLVRNFQSSLTTNVNNIALDANNNIVWGNTQGKYLADGGMYDGMTIREIKKNNVEYLNKELADKWNYNLSLGSPTRSEQIDFSNPTYREVLIQTAKNDPTKPAVLETNMGDVDFSLGLTQFAHYEFAPRILQPSTTHIFPAKVNYAVYFDDNNIGCFLYDVGNGNLRIKGAGYDPTYTYDISTDNGGTFNTLLPTFSPILTGLVNIIVRKESGGCYVDYKFTIDYNNKSFQWQNPALSSAACASISNSPSCQLTDLDIDRFNIASATQFPASITFNSGTVSITVLAPDASGGNHSNHKFQISSLYSVYQSSFNGLGAVYIDFSTLLNTQPEYGYHENCSYRIVDNATNEVVASFAFNAGFFVSLVNDCTIEWGGDLIDDPTNEIYLYNRTVANPSRITGIAPYNREQWSGEVTKAFLSPLASNVPDALAYAKSWGRLYRDTYIVPFIAQTAFNRRIDKIAENGEVLPNIGSRARGGLMAKPAIAQLFANYYAANCNGCPYTPTISSWWTNPVVIQIWEDFLVGINSSTTPSLYVEQYIGRYKQDQYAWSYFENFYIAKYNSTPQDLANDYESYIGTAATVVPAAALRIRETWKEYMTKYFYSFYVNGYREGIFEEPTPSSISVVGGGTPINYRDVINPDPVVALPTDTDFSIYDLRNLDYVNGREVQTPVTIPFASPFSETYYNTNNLYLGNTENWNAAPSASNMGLLNMRRGLLKSYKVLGEKHFSPYITPTTYKGQTETQWEEYFGKDIRPGQWLGMLKYASVIGAEYFYSFYARDYDDDVPHFYDSGNNNIWQGTTPAYAQGITSRFMDIFRRGKLLQGSAEYPTETNYTLFDNNVPNLLIAAKKLNNSYIISANIGVNSNNYYDINGDNTPDRASSLEETAHFMLKEYGPNNSITEYPLTLNARRQGSVYYYERKVNDGDEVIFYQLDGWHQYEHPFYWTKDFVFEAELLDNSLPSNFAIKTEVKQGGSYIQATNITTNFTDFNSYVTYTLDPTLEGNTYGLEYNFEPRSAYSSATFKYGLDIKARTTWTSSTSEIEVFLDNVSMGTIKLTNTSWAWINSAAATPVLLPFISANENHVLRLVPLNGGIEIDVIKLKNEVEILSNGVLCLGVELSAPNFDMPPSANISYQWLLNGASISGATSSSFVANDPGSYSLQVTIDGSVLISAAVLVNPTPPTPMITQSSICGSPATLTVVSPTGLLYSYNWSNGAHSLSTSITQSGNYTVTVTDNNGCTSSLSQDISVFALPVANSTTMTLCARDHESLDADFNLTSIESIVTGIATNVVVTWYEDAALTIPIVNPSLYPSFGGHVYAQVTNTVSGCTNSCGVALIVNAFPIVDILPTSTPTNAPLSVCVSPTNTFTFTASVTNFVAPFTYVWKKGSTIVGTSSSYTTTFPSPTTINYTVEVTAYGCATIANKSVIVNPLPTPTIIATNAAGTVSFIPNATSPYPTYCADKDLYFRTTTPYVSYQWRLSNTPIANETADSHHPTGVQGNRNVNVTDANGCSANSNVLALSIPSAAAGADKSVCKTGSITIGTSSQSGYSYQWSPTTNLTNFNSAYATFNANGLVPGVYYYTVTATNNIGCSKTDEVMVTVKNCARTVHADDSDILPESSLSLYPNPTSENVTLSMVATAEGEAQIEVFDMTGRLVYANKAAVQEGETTQKVDMHDWAGGMYLFSVKIGEKIFNQKVVKE
jgi:hypothetical protein